MYTKSIVALYILPRALYLVVLSSDRKKVLQSITFDLPPHLIQEYRVKDIAALAEALKATWKKYKIVSRAVGIVIPEFAAYTKLLSLPKLPIGELNEAVLWAAQEYIPHEPEDLLMDWKLVKQKDDGTDVFIAAIRKDILLPYADAIEKADLYPLYVEIPSLSIARVAPKSEAPILLLYGNVHESIVAIANEGTILVSSVVHGNSQKEILSTIKKITGHYKEFGITAIYAGGELGTIPDEVSKVYNLQVKPIDNPLKNISPQIFHEFLIPISLATTDITQPSDPFTINLLPQKYVLEYKSTKTRKQTWSLLFSTTIFVWVCLFSALFVYLYLSQGMNTQTAKKNSNLNISQKRAEAVAFVKNLNTLSDKILAIKKSYIVPQEVINIVESSRTSNVSVTSYKIDFDTNEIRVGGTASNRVALVEFKQNLEKTNKVQNVTIPITNFEVETNLDYTVFFKMISKTEKP